MTQTIEREQTFVIDAPETDLADRGANPDDLAHYVDQRLDQDVTAAMIEGTEVVALCGYRWVPYRDPNRCKVCPPCVAALEAIVSG